MSSDTHVTHFYREGGGENRDAISVDFRERLVFDRITLEQDTYWWVATKDKGLIESKELGCHTLV